MTEQVVHNGAEQHKPGRVRSTCSCGFAGEWRYDSADAYKDFVAHETSNEKGEASR